MPNKATLLAILLICSFIILKAQDTIKVDLYRSTDNYIAKLPTDTNISLVIKEIGEKYILSKKFIDEQTGKSIKGANSSWAILYKGATYFNLGYTNDLNNWKLFVKLDLEGRNFCSVFIDDKTPNLIKNSGNYYGGGLTGIMIKESTK